MSGRLPWLVSLPLMAAGCLSGHSVAYRIVEPAGAAGVHGYLAFAPFVVAAATALGIVAATRAAVAGRTQWSGSARLYAVLPPLAFVLQEHLERAFHEGGVPLGTALEPAFLMGLVLQLPFAFCALVAVRSILRIAQAAGARIRRRRPRHVRTLVTARPRPAVLVPRARALAASWAQRAPPLSA